LGFQNQVGEAAYSTLLDYHSLYRMKTDPNFSPPNNRYLPPLSVYEDSPQRSMLADFPSRLELFKECYVKRFTFLENEAEIDEKEITTAAMQSQTSKTKII